MLENIGTGEAEYIAGLVTERDHVDNGNHSLLHPLTIVHYTTGAQDHYTVQSAWMQAIFMRKMGRCSDQSLVTMAIAMTSATKKEDVKAATAIAFGHGVTGIANCNFYRAGGPVSTCDVTLGTVMRRITRALGKEKKLGRIIIEKDGAFLKGRGISSFTDLDAYKLKEGQQDRWGELNALVTKMIDGANPS
ncbi:MAG: hypothetical protein VX913_02770 [Planctomycetota bacterium]|nr:hypothetical protein [Planctomycetota bacterium]